MDDICGEIHLPKMSGKEIFPGIMLVGEPTPVAGSNKLTCLAEIGGALVLVELSIKLKEVKGV